MADCFFDSPDPEATGRLAAELGRSIGASGLIIALKGPLGAGKTVFVKGLADGLGVDARLVSSPTFVIAQQYPIVARDGEPIPGATMLHHVDLYRLEQEAELDSIGFDDLFHAGAVLAVEWADRFPGVLGPDRLEIAFDGAAARPQDAPGRRMTIEAHGTLAEAALTDWRERVERAERAGGDCGSGPRRSLREHGFAAFLFLSGAAGFGLAGGVLDGPGDGSPRCDAPVAVASDLFGTQRVRCGDSERSEGSETSEADGPTGLGALFFGGAFDLAEATQIQLEALPHLGPARAKAILEARAERPFESVAALQRIGGIGPRSIERWERWLEVTPAAEGDASASDPQDHREEKEQPGG